MRVLVKVCGVTSIETACACQSAGVDAIGFVFAPSPRKITPETARGISSKVGGAMARVGVFVDQDPGVVLEIAAFAHLTHVQLHGSESPNWCRFLRERGLRVIKAFRVRSGDDLLPISGYDVDLLLLDSYVPGVYGGTGVRLSLEILERYTGSQAIVVAGGLNEKNVGEVIKTIRPFGVDVSSGVEFSGSKSSDLIHQFVSAVRVAEMFEEL